MREEAESEEAGSEEAEREEEESKEAGSEEAESEETEIEEVRRRRVRSCAYSRHPKNNKLDTENKKGIWNMQKLKDWKDKWNLENKNKESQSKIRPRTFKATYSHWHNVILVFVTRGFAFLLTFFRVENQGTKSLFETKTR